MIGFRIIAAALLATATLGLTACGGGDDDATQKASESLQQQGIDEKSADDLARTAQRLKDEGFTKEDAAKLQSATAAVQKRVQGLQQRIVRITKDVQAKRIGEQEGTEQIQEQATEIQREALSGAEELEKAGALPESAKKQVEEARKRLEQSSTGK